MNQGPVTQPVPHIGPIGDSRPLAHPAADIDLGPIGFIPLGEGRAYRLEGKTIAVFRQRDGRLFATDNACPHKAGPLADGLLGSGKVICPLHMWKIDLATGQCLGEDSVVQTYPVREANGRIVITLTAPTALTGERN